MHPTYRLNDPASLPSPALLIFPELVRRNLAAMIAMAGSAARLRPHVKTHKMPALIRLAELQGIHKHKCATIAEAEMIARAGGHDVLIAYPMVGPNIGRLVGLVRQYPQTTFRTTVDNAGSARALSDAFVAAGLPPLSVFIDLDAGMGRTGIAAEGARELAPVVVGLPGLQVDGVHLYDGHIRDFDLEARRQAAAPGLRAAVALQQQLQTLGRTGAWIVAGGTPTFPVHAGSPEVAECSPGTCVLHDASYGTKFPDLPFTPAALILTRVVSRPRPDRICLDVGYKAVAADPQGDRVTVLGVPDAVVGPQSEEHLVVDTPHARELPPGTPVLAIPTHICPTCALYSHAVVIENGNAVDRWPVEARDRSIGV